jgi:glycosyltransferase involved in cell wall biosynthesis
VSPAPLGSDTVAGDVLFLHASDEAYGADRVLLEMALGLRERGWRPRVILPRDVAPGWLSAQLAEAAVPTQRLDLAVARRRYLDPMRLPAYLLALLRARAAIRHIARQRAPAVIHVNTSALLVAAILGRPARARLVWHVHEIVVRPLLLAWLFRVLPPLTADRVIAISEAVRRHLTPAGWFRDRVVRVYNGLPDRPTAPFAPLVGSRPVVAFVGRLNRWKGQDVFVEAAVKLVNRHPEARFVIAGDAPPGEERRVEELGTQIRDAGVDDRVELLGFVPDGAAVLDAAAIAVVPSVWPEPFGLTVLEAMRAGCATVATNHGGAAELIEDGRTGLLVPPADVESLAAAIGRLLDDPGLRARLGAAAREHVSATFGVERMLDDIEAVYRALLA